jgi:hypothetical protein
LKAGDKVCQRCFNSLPNLIEVWFDSEAVPVESPDLENLNPPIRAYHQFDPRDECTILCKRTSKSLKTDVFTLQADENDEEKESSLKEVNTAKDISIQNFVILEQDEKRYLAQVIKTNQKQQNVTVELYKPSSPLPSYIKFFSKMEDKLNINWQNIIASFIVPPISRRRNQLSLSKEHFIDIQNFCR